MASRTRVAELPPHLRKKRSQLTATGSIVIAPMNGKTTYTTSMQTDFPEYKLDVGSNTKSKMATPHSAVTLGWEGEDAGCVADWQSTIRDFNESMVKSQGVFIPPVVPDLSSSWNFGAEKVKYATQMQEDMSIDYKHFETSGQRNRPKGPVRSFIQLGDEHAEKNNPNPHRIQSLNETTFRQYSQQEQTEAKPESVKAFVSKQASQVALGQKQWQTTSIMSNSAPSSEDAAKARGPAHSVGRSLLSFGSQPMSYETAAVNDYRDPASYSEGGQLKSAKPNQYKSSIQIGQANVRLDYATAAGDGYVDFGASSLQPVVSADTSSKVVLGTEKGIAWKSVANDRIDPRHVPGAYVNARDLPGYRGVPNLSVSRKLAKEKLKNTTKSVVAYESSYHSDFPDRSADSDQFSTARRLVSTLSLAEGHENDFSSTYEAGSGQPLTDEQVAQAAPPASNTATGSAVSIGIPGYKSSWATTNKLEVPPPYKQLPICTSTVKQHAEPENRTWETTSSACFQPYMYKR